MSPVNKEVTKKHPKNYAGVSVFQVVLLIWVHGALVQGFGGLLTHAAWGLFVLGWFAFGRDE